LGRLGVLMGPESTHLGTKHEPDVDGAFDRLINGADAETLRHLVRRLADGPVARRTCLEFLRGLQTEDPIASAETDAEIVLTMWDELLPELQELDSYGGGDYDLVDRVHGLLYDLSEALIESNISNEVRRELMDNVFPYLLSHNSGVTDTLYEVAYSLCETDDDVRHFAGRLEATGQDWPCEHARNIYRGIGDRDKFLQLRSRRMEYGGDYYDLATFHWRSGEKELALAVAWEGMANGKGRMDELRGFLANRASESGDRPTFLELEFAQATDRLSLEKYEAFKAICTESEWTEYEPRIMKCVSESDSHTSIPIYMHREDLELAVDVVARHRYPNMSSFVSDVLLDAAARLETKFPEKILAFYLSGLTHLNESTSRKRYAHYAQNAERARRVWVEILERPEEWKKFAKTIKWLNARRPAFQQEFSKVVSGWGAL
jgi:hypothetical protein